MAFGHGFWPWHLAMAFGHSLWPWHFAIAFGQGLWPRPLAMAFGQGLWHGLWASPCPDKACLADLPPESKYCNKCGKPLLEAAELIEADIDSDLKILGFSTGDGQLRTSDEEWSILRGLQAGLFELMNES